MSVEEVLACIEERRAHPDYNEATPRLVDLSAARGDIPPDQIQALARRHSESPFRGRCAFVAPADLQYGLGRMFEANVQRGRRVGVFRTRESALAWLDEVVPEAFSPPPGPGPSGL